ncbi:type III secretion system inner rod subunit SctI [Castellaniella defragrans]|uniref:Type III secretion protein I n=1 Tax=Castellaniella defragrans TaxID=75697 RepID=A0A7W9TQC7_CASDE|nr:type III secretion system inner rod subunit SctI [Castellaniella defragrans]KAB0602093.1 EscI/YscI/HrpB family type III secretion system inner rod protein [Castellaniella defragrans]MBB6084953.1 type III secretion protein I [Castellaniella defragrans]
MEITALTAALGAQALPAADPVVRTEPARLATERFSALMAAPEAPAAGGVAAALQAAFAAPPEAPPTLGGEILAGLRGVATDFSGKWRDIARGLDGLGAQPAISDMLRLQTELLQVSVQYELVGKAVSRSTQNIDTLVRMS